MAFTAETLGVIVQPLGGLGVRMVSYRSDDPSGTITGAGYFAGASSYGLRVGDLIFVAPVDGAVATYIATIASFDASGNATAAVVANALTSADIGDTVQAYSANLDAWSAVAPSGYLTTASAASTYLTIATAASTYLTSATAASTYLTTAAAASGYQPLDADLTALAGVSTQAYGRGLLAYADEAAFKAGVNLEAGTDFNTYDAQLSSLIRQNSQSAAYELVLADGGKHIFHPSADTTARTITIPANGSVAFPIGTAVTFINQNSAGVITIAITTDTMRLAGAGTTGSRTLAANGIATAVKVTSTEWIISGTGLT